MKKKNSKFLIINKYPQNIFLFVQVTSLILFMFESQLSFFFGESNMQTANVNSKNIFIIGILFLYIIFTYFLLMNFKTYRIEVSSIKFPFVIHLILITLEVIYVMHEIKQSNSFLELRETGSQIPDIFKLTSVVISSLN